MVKVDKLTSLDASFTHTILFLFVVHLLHLTLLDILVNFRPSTIRLKDSFCGQYNYFTTQSLFGKSSPGYQLSVLELGGTTGSFAIQVGENEITSTPDVPTTLSEHNYH